MCSCCVDCSKMIKQIQEYIGIAMLLVIDYQR